MTLGPANAGRRIRRYRCDISPDEVHYEAMIKARDSGVASASGRLILVQENDEKKFPGILNLPMYSGGATPNALGQNVSVRFPLPSRP